jgi:hypothetical protein
LKKTLKGRRFNSDEMVREGSGSVVVKDYAASRKVAVSSPDEVDFLN